jgi:hypothetical protein
MLTNASYVLSVHVLEREKGRREREDKDRGKGEGDGESVTVSLKGERCLAMDGSETGWLKRRKSTQTL